MQSTRTKWFPLEKKARSFILGAVFLTGFIAPYSHIVFNNTSAKGVFGFPTMSSFLFSIGFPVFGIVLAFLLNYASDYLPNGLNKVFKIFSTLTAFTGFYFLIWAINPYVEKDFHPAFYYGSMIFVSTILAYSLKLYSRSSVSVLKSKIRYIMNLMIVDAVKKGHVKDEDRYEEEIVFPALDKLDEK